MSQNGVNQFDNQYQSYQNDENSNNSQPKIDQHLDFTTNSTSASKPDPLFDDLMQNSQYQPEKTNTDNLLNLIDDQSQNKANDILNLYNEGYSQIQNGKQNDLLDDDLFGQVNYHFKSDDPFTGNFENNISEFDGNDENDLNINIQFPSDFLTPEEKAKQQLQSIRSSGNHINSSGFGSPELERDFFNKKEEERKNQMESQLKEQEDSLLPNNHYRSSEIPNYFSSNEKQKDDNPQIDLFTPPTNEEANNRREFVFPDYNPSEPNNNDIFGLNFEDNNNNFNATNSLPIEFVDLNENLIQSPIDQITSDFTNAPINKDDLIISNLGIKEKETTFNPSFDQFDQNLSINQTENTNELKIELPEEEEIVDVQNENLLYHSFDQIDSLNKQEVGNTRILNQEKKQNENSFNPSFDEFDSGNLNSQKENTNELQINLLGIEEEFENKKQDQVENKNENSFNPSFDQLEASITNHQNENTNELQIDLPEEIEEEKAQNENSFNPSFDQFNSVNTSNQKENTNELQIELPKEEEEEEEEEEKEKIENEEKAQNENSFNPSFDQFNSVNVSNQKENTNELQIELPKEEEEEEEEKEKTENEEKAQNENSFNPSFDQFNSLDTNYQNKNTNELQIELPKEEEEETKNEEKAQNENSFNPSFDHLESTVTNDTKVNTNELQIELPEEEEKDNQEQKQKENSFNPLFDNFDSINASNQNENTNEFQINLDDEEIETENKNQDQEENKNDAFEAAIANDQKEEEKEETKNEEIAQNENSFNPSFDQFNSVNTSNQKENTNELQIELPKEEEEEEEEKEKTENEEKAQNENSFNPSFDQFNSVNVSNQKENTNELQIELPKEEEEEEKEKTENEEKAQNENSFNPSFDQFNSLDTNYQNKNTNELQIELPSDDSNDMENVDETKETKAAQEKAKKNDTFSSSFDQFSFNSFTPVSSTNEIKIKIDDKDENENGIDVGNKSVIERGSVSLSNDSKPNESQNEIGFNSDDDFESLDQEQETRHRSSRNINKEGNENNLDGIKNDDEVIDDNESNPTIVNDNINKNNIDKNKQEAAISETTNKSEIADRSTNKSIVIGENINKSAISNENINKLATSNENINKLVTSDENINKLATSNENINKSTVVDENQKQETKKEINNYSKEIKTQKNNDNSSVQKSKQENYDDQERRSFVLPNLPFSMNPIHFSFEASMKYDDSLKTPQFKALPIPTLDASNNSNDLKKTQQNSDETKRNGNDDEGKKNIYSNDDFGIINAFQSISSPPPVSQKQTNQMQIVIEQPIIAEKIEDMKSFSIFKHYLESRIKS